MTAIGWAQIALVLALVVGCAIPLSRIIASVFFGERNFLSPMFGPVERGFYRLAGVDPAREQDWFAYTIAMVVFSIAGFLLLYAVQRLQNILPLNPRGFDAVPPDLAFNTSISFITNTNWQNYSGETTMSHLTQMLGLTVHNFLSAATGLAMAFALVRGFTRSTAATVGNFWVDVTRITLYVLLPFAFVLALVFVALGVPQTLAGAVEATTLEGAKQTISIGPMASQEVIKELGTNGGGFFNANSSHPFENPTPLSNFLELLAILLIPAALCYTFGRMVGEVRQGWAVLAAMLVLFVPLLGLTAWAEGRSNPAYPTQVAQQPSLTQAGGNMEGKETRFGVANSALWSAATTAASNGSVNAMHDSFTPLGGLIPMWLIQLGEVIFGGVGSGLYGMLIFAIIAVFIAGLMVGRTPEYLGKKLEAFEMKMASLVILIPPFLALVGTAIAVCYPAGRAGTANPGAHGFSEILYAFSSAAGNNGSAFAGLSANTPFYNTLLGIVMWSSRFWLIVPVLAIAGSLATKKRVPLATDTPLFVVLLAATVVIVGALAFFPALALGPVVEELQFQAH
jgi:K+-transporting ATPase ATPase A chain